MPRGDQTGPNGAGPRTGRGLGNCPVTGAPDSNTNIPRVVPRGIGRGRGSTGVGLGRGRAGRQPINPNR